MVILHLCTNSLLVVKQLQHMQKSIVGGDRTSILSNFSVIKAKWGTHAAHSAVLQSMSFFFLWHNLMVMKVTEKFGRSYFLEHYHKLKTICLSDFSAEEIAWEGPN